MTIATDSHLLVQNAYDYLVEEITSSRIRTGARLYENRIASDPVSYTHLDVYKRQVSGR